MSMSRKEFEAIGAAVFDADISDRALENVALALADALVSQADSFNPVLFLRSCGLEGDDLGTKVRNFSTRLAMRQRSIDARRMAAMEANRPAVGAG
jgi:hypothetical protein